MRLFDEELGLLVCANDLLNSANIMAESIVRATQVMNITLANIFWHRRAMDRDDADEIIQAVVNVNLVIEYMALELDYFRIRNLRSELLRSQGQNLRAQHQFFRLDHRTGEGLEIIEGYKDTFLAIWNHTHGGMMNDRLECDIRIRRVWRNDRGFLFFD